MQESKKASMQESGTARDGFYFAGFDSPNTTPVPDVIFDQLLVWLGEAEIRALLYIVRRTFGFKKEHDAISFNQFLRGITTREGKVLDQGCGIRNRTNLSRALKGLETKGIVESDKGWDERGENQTTIYRLRFKSDAAEQGVVPEEYYPGTGKALPVVPREYPQQTVVQQTVLHINSGSNSRPSSYRTSKGEGVQGGNQDGDVYAQPERQPDRRPAERTPSTNGLAPIGEILARRPSPTSRGRPPKPTPYITQLMTDWSSELHDYEHLKSNITQAMRLYAASGLDENAFVARLYEARSITKDRGNISKLATDVAPLKNKMPYYFAVLRDLLGMKDHGDEGDDQPPRGTARP